MENKPSNNWRKRSMEDVDSVAAREPNVLLAKKAVTDFQNKLKEESKGSYTRVQKQKLAELRAIVDVEKEKALIVVKKQRAQAFIDEFLKNGGDAVAAAMKLTGTTNYHSAAVIANRYMKEYRLLGMGLLSKKGLTYGKFLEVAIRNMETSKDTDWWDRLMRIAKYEDFMPHPAQQPTGNVVNIIGAQGNLQKEFGFIDVEEEKPAEITEGTDDGSEEL